MTDTTGPLDLRAVGDRLEALLGDLQSRLEPPDWERVSEAIGLVTDLYGGGLARVVELVPAEDVRRLAADDLVASLLILHGLHPEALEVRVAAALHSVRPYLAAHGGDVEVLGLDGDAGVLRLRLLGTCCGCPSSSVTLERLIREAVEAAAPEVTALDVVDDSVPIAGGSHPVPIELTCKPAAAG